MNSFKNKVALITGAASGIGRATAFAFSEKGAKVILVDIFAEGCNEVAEQLKNANKDIN